MTLQENAQVIAEHVEGMQAECRVCNGTNVCVGDWRSFECIDCKGPGYTPIIDLDTLLVEMDKAGWEYMITIAGDEFGHYLPYCAFRKRHDVEGFAEMWADTPTEAAYSAAAQCFQKMSA